MEKVLSKIYKIYHDFSIPLLLIFEIILCYVIIRKIPYTEIDWIAYMQEVGGFLSGELNYMNLKGDTGPLVYPAGFVYVFTILRWVTDDGLSILKGQIIFAILYLMNLFLVFLIYDSPNLWIRKKLIEKMKHNSSLSPSDLTPNPTKLLDSLLHQTSLVPRWIFLFLIFSKRIHSIYMLRMFNDCVAVFLGFLAILLFLQNKWRAGSIFYSLSVSIKMNMLLMAPGILLLFLLATGPRETFLLLSICAVVQLILGMPFLMSYPVQYISRSFDLGRVFTYQWTVNLKFLPEEIFVSKELSLILLFGTILGMVLFYIKWNRKIQSSLSQLKLDQEKDKSLSYSSTSSSSSSVSLSPHFILLTIFVSNFIGIVFARTLHYQFYCWYYFSLPYLLLHVFGFLPATPLSSSMSLGSSSSSLSRMRESWVYFLSRVLLIVCAMVIIEISFNIFPATWWSSLNLQLVHFLLLMGIFLTPVPCPFGKY